MDLLRLLNVLGVLGPGLWFAMVVFFVAYMTGVWLIVSATWSRLDRPKFRYLALMLELVLLLALPGGYIAQSKHEKQQVIDAKRATMTKALDRYYELCKGAGEQIYRTVEGVDGIFLMKIELDPNSDVSQYSINAKSPYESLGDFGSFSKNRHTIRYMSFDGYIKSFLRDKLISEKSEIKEAAKIEPLPAFRYVEAIDPADHQRYRYTGSWQEVDTNDWKKWNERIDRLGYIPREMLLPVDWIDGVRVQFVLTREPPGDPPPRYGVTYDDLETPEERQMWIAGSALKVVDLQTGELLGQRIGYLHDRGGGSAAGGRQPWTFAQTERGWSCPAWNVIGNSNDKFVLKVLHPKPGEIQ